MKSLKKRHTRVSGYPQGLRKMDSRFCGNDSIATLRLNRFMEMLNLTNPEIQL